MEVHGVSPTPADPGARSRESAVTPAANSAVPSLPASSGLPTESAVDAATPSSLRAARLARIKAAIADGTYDTDEKLELALSKMFDRLGFQFDD